MADGQTNCREKYMPTALEQTLQVLQIIVQSVPIGIRLRKLPQVPNGLKLLL